MPNLDRFGGSQAWDAYCARNDAITASLIESDPGCASCSSYRESDYSDEHGMCIHGYYEQIERFAKGVSNFMPTPDLVAARGCVPCEYENWSER